MATVTKYNTKLPLQQSQEFGLFEYNIKLEDAVKQDLKMLILTPKGSRINNIPYGTDLQKSRFEIKNSSMKTTLEMEIRNAVQNYMPQIMLQSVQVFFAEDLPTVTGFPSISLQEWQIFIAIYYTILVGTNFQIPNQNLGLIVSNPNN